MLFGYFSLFEITSIPTDAGADCFAKIGQFRLCSAMQKIAIYTSLFLLMTQALISRILVPGMSNFVNASVCRLLYSVALY